MSCGESVYMAPDGSIEVWIKQQSVRNYYHVDGCHFKTCIYHGIPEFWGREYLGEL